MKLTFKINGSTPDPYFGVVEGYVLEGINQISQIELILVSEFDLCDQDCAAYIGGSVTLGLSDTFEGELLWSRFDGIIYEFHVLTLAGDNDTFVKYQMIVRPTLWELSFRIQSRSFPDKTKIEVIEQVFKEWNLIKGQEYEICLFKQNGSHYPKMTQVIQNQVSDLVFVQNLMKEAGINYHFVTDKKDAERDTLWLVDHNGFFDEPFKKTFGEKKAVPYKPYAGMPCSDFKFRIESLERQFRATIMDTVAYTNFGDGIKDAFESELTSVDNGYAGLMASYGCGGESKDIANREATKRADYLKSSQVTYEGRSNFFLFRPGEKYPIGDGCGKPRKNKLDILLTSVCHHFQQNIPSAFTGNQDVDYSNIFFAVNKDAPYRPDQTSGRSIMEMKRAFTKRHSACAPDEPQSVTASDIENVESYDLRKRITELKQELAVARDLSGIMVGEVIKDAWITKHRELLCLVKNERYPDGVTVKVALGWLCEGGWLSLLPRVGMQVYFQFLNGEGGQNEAIMLGYRSNGSYTLIDPDGSMDSMTLLKGEDPTPGAVTEKVVSKSKFSTKNKYRNALRAEKDVAEIAVIDGGEDSVYLHANNRICAFGDKSISLSTEALNQKASCLSQDFGSVGTHVSGSVMEGIDGAHYEMTGKEISIISGDTMELHGVNSVVLTEDKGNKLTLNQTQIQLFHKNGHQIYIDESQIQVAHSGDNQLFIDKDKVDLRCGKASVYTTKDKEAVMKMDPGGGGNIIKVTDSEIVSEISKGPSTIINADGMEFAAGKTGVSVKKDGDVIITGNFIKLNC
jgi:uncharacterized protein involved in type VI secretion and phage assembly